MLQIKINNQSLDLSPDISIPLVFENPFFSEDKIPTPHALNFDVPKTERNLGVFGRVDRLNARLDAFAEWYDAEIWFDGIRMLEGVVSVAEIKRRTIELTFDCADFLGRFKNKLWQNDFGKISFGFARKVDGGSTRPSYIDTTASRSAYFAYWKDQISAVVPNFIAAPLCVKGYEWITPAENTSGRPPGGGGFTNQFAGRINQYYITPASNPDAPRPDNPGPPAYMDKIIPAVRVGYLLSHIDPTLGSALSEVGLERLMLVCAYHPSYQTTDRNPVWSINPDTLECSCRISDFLPDITTAEFVVEILKLVGASLYTVSRRMAIAGNNSVLNSLVAMDWSGKVVDGYSLSYEQGLKYKLSFDAESDTKLSSERKTMELTSVSEMLFYKWSDSDTDTARISETGQVFEVYPNPQLSNDQYTHWDFRLIEDYPFNEGKEGTEDSEEEAFEVVCKTSPVRTVVATEVLRDNQQTPSFDWAGFTRRHYYYASEVEKPSATRPTKLYVGMYDGSRYSEITPDYYYPYISSSPFYENGLIRSLHSLTAQWVGRRRRVLKGQVRLDSLELSRLDLRKKVHFGGCTFLIKELTVNLKYREIGLAEVELVEC